jgi:hypothetical protein
MAWGYGYVNFEWSTNILSYDIQKKMSDFWHKPNKTPLNYPD